MEWIVYSCLEYQKLITNVLNSNVPRNIQEEIVEEYTKVAPEHCSFQINYK